MEYTLAVFRARNETITFANLLKSYGVNVIVVTTPRQINVSCGISVRFNHSDFITAKNLLARRRFDSFGGFYLVKQIGANLKAVPI